MDLTYLTLNLTLKAPFRNTLIVSGSRYSVFDEIIWQ